MKSFKAQISVAVVCVVLGLMLAYQFQAVKKSTSVARSQALEDLSNQLKEAQKQKAEFEKSITSLEKKIEEYEENATTTSGLANALKKELDNVRMLAGLTNVEGSGIIITVAPQVQSLDNTLPEPINYVFLLLIVNELNASGAEAVMINNQRIVNTTQIREGGTTIIINDVRYNAFDKFEIKAIGDPVTLDVGTNIVKQELMGYGINVTTQKSDNITIFKYNKPIDFEYVKKVEEGE